MMIDPPPSGRARLNAWGLAMVATIACGVPARADCTDLLERFNAAMAARAVTEAKAIEAQVARDAVCGTRLVEVQRRRAALQLMLAQPLLAGGAPAGEAEQLLLEADTPDVLWQAAKALGDLRFSQHRYADAAAAFERALEIIRNPGKTPRPPEGAIIGQIFDRTTQSRLLAASGTDRLRPATYVTAAKDDRDGAPAGSLSEDIRGFRPVVVPLPIQFETASVVLSPIGDKAARELLAALLHQKPLRITLVGHTDERGSDAFNLRLSEGRVQAVKKFLQEQGLGTPVTVIAKGKSEPLRLTNASEFSQEEIWALNRRVEWRRD
jgi:outer membrane protein OmpA-like peptidoglycan-associated protein